MQRWLAFDFLRRSPHRRLQGMAGWELPQPEPDDTKAKASKAAASRDQSKRGQRNKPR